MQKDLVTIFDENGNEIGRKSRLELDKKVDIFQTVYVRIYIGEQILLTKIIRKKDSIAKTNEGKWGLPIATILRNGESLHEALQRAALDDIGIMPEIIRSYDRRFIAFKYSSPRIVHAFDAVLDSIPEIEGREFSLVKEWSLQGMHDVGELAETALIFEHFK
jgi:hypothetical protein